MFKLLKTFAFSLCVGPLLIGDLPVIASPQDDAPTDNEEAPLLTIGSMAPAIDVEHWVSNGNGAFKPVTTFEAGKVYVVEFWATWCGPCIASMPHLAETQVKYANEGVQLISISDEDLETVNAFLERKLPGVAKDEKEDGEDEKATDKEQSEEEPQTYGQLTSAYCLTTDPDSSVNDDYMKAAAQNGIPTCFIVGKTGEIEWIGHPMRMDKPLAEVVQGSWNRDDFKVTFIKEQERAALMAKIMKKMRSGDTDEALQDIAEAKLAAADDVKAIADLDRLELSVKLSPVMAKIRSGDVEVGIKMVSELMQSVSPAQRAQLVKFRFRLLMQQGDKDAAADAINEMASEQNADPKELNDVAWQVYEYAKDAPDEAESIVAAAIAAAEKALETPQENGFVLDTLAHLVYLQGNLDRAIELQEKALTYKAGANQKMKEFLEQLRKAKEEVK